MTKNNSVVVVGAGIVGVATAIWLQRDGMKVTLVDREGFAAGASYGNAGVLAASAIVPVSVPGLAKKAPGMLLSANEPLFLRWSYLPKLLPWLVRFMARANDRDVQITANALSSLMHDSVDQHLALAKGTGAEAFIEPGDYLYVYGSEAAYRKDHYAWSIRRQLGFESEVLEGDDLHAYDPVIAEKFPFGVRCLNHGRITDPGAYVQALGTHFLEEGGELLIADVSDIRTENGKAQAIVTSAGEVEADQIVLTAGAWSGTLAKKLGARVLMEAERGYHVEFVGANIPLRSAVMITDKKFAINAMPGRLRCAGIVEFGGLDAPPSKAPFELLKRNAAEIFPDMEYDSIEEWMGPRPSTVDSLPLIGAFEGVENVWAGFGHQHLGLTGGPKTGRWLAQMIKGDMPNTDLEPFRVNRF